MDLCERLCTDDKFKATFMTFMKIVMAFDKKSKDETPAEKLAEAKEEMAEAVEDLKEAIAEATGMDDDKKSDEHHEGGE